MEILNTDPENTKTLILANGSRLTRNDPPRLSMNGNHFIYEPGDCTRYVFTIEFVIDHFEIEWENEFDVPGTVPFDHMYYNKMTFVSLWSRNGNSYNPYSVWALWDCLQIMFNRGGHW
jgi:hypothetical protein